MGYIYKIRNTVNNKLYIGQTKRSIQERFKEHCKTQDSAAIHLAMQKYGISNFEVSQLEECSEAKLNERERYWIEYYDTMHTGYNMNPGGGGGGDGFKSANKYWEANPQERQKQIKIGLQAANEYWENHPEERDKHTKDMIKAAQEYWKSHPEENKQRTQKFLEAAHKKLSKKVLCIELNREFESIREAARQLNLSHANISRACQESKRTSGGFHWRYI